MWAHYSKSHTGIVIGYNTRNEYFFDDLKHGTTLVKVRYQERRPKFGISPDFLFQGFGYTKSKDWKYEKEWRALSSNDDRTVDTVFEPVDKECIKSVYLGIRIAERDREKILKIIETELPHVKLFQLELDEKEFRLNALQINPPPP